jgi:hypothetical protein
MNTVSECIHFHSGVGEDLGFLGCDVLLHN